MGKVKTFEEYQASKNEDTVHGTPGEESENGTPMFEVNEDSCCSTECQGKIHEMYEAMIKEMKKCHEDDSDLSAEDYMAECDKIMEACKEAAGESCKDLMVNSSDEEKPKGDE